MVSNSAETTTATKLLNSLLAEKEAAPILGVKPQTLALSRMTGSLLGVPAPKHIKFARAVRYRLSDLQDWLDALDTDGKEGM